MKKLVLFGILNIFLLNICFANAEEDDIYPKGEDKIYMCIKKFNGPDKSGISSITNPIDSKKYLICKGSTRLDTLYQAVLDVLFTNIDKQVESYLATLPKKNITAEEGDKVSKKFSQTEDFYKKYKKVCDSGVLKYTGKFIENKKNQKDLGVKELSTDGKLSNFVEGKGGICKSLMEIKLKAYESTAWLILKRNLVDSYKKDKQEFMKGLKKKYTDFLMKFSFYLGQIGVIKDKWNKGNPKAKN